MQLRELLQKAGLRDLEREATYAIEHNKTRHLLVQPREFGYPQPISFSAIRWSEPVALIEGLFRLVLFELPVGYGLYPGRALLILVALILIMPLGYLVFIDVEGARSTTKGGIYRIWPDSRLATDNDAVEVLTYGDVPKNERAHKLVAKGGWAAHGYALYFSLLSAFNIGWRELNVGAWLTKLQFTEYALRARGWPRFFSGLQSLVSVYLLAIWALTYFGRPFQ